MSVSDEMRAYLASAATLREEIASGKEEPGKMCTRWNVLPYTEKLALARLLVPVVPNERDVQDVMFSALHRMDGSTEIVVKIVLQRPVKVISVTAAILR